MTYDQQGLKSKYKFIIGIVCAAKPSTLLSPVHSQLNAIPIYKCCPFWPNKIIVDIYLILYEHIHTQIKINSTIAFFIKVNKINIWVKFM